MESFSTEDAERNIINLSMLCHGTDSEGSVEVTVQRQLSDVVHANNWGRIMKTGKMKKQCAQRLSAKRKRYSVQQISDQSGTRPITAFLTPPNHDASQYNDETDDDGDDDVDRIMTLCKPFSRKGKTIRKVNTK